MNDEFTGTLSEQTQCLLRELYGDQTRKASRADDSDVRVVRAELYADRLKNGLDIWTGQPLDDACKEATRMQGLGSRPKCGERRPRIRNGVVKAA